jgi:protein ImuB
MQTEVDMSGPGGGGTSPDLFGTDPRARRIVAAWLPFFSINIRFNKLQNNQNHLVSLVQIEGGRSIIVAVDARAQALGIAPGQAAADARALYPSLVTAEADPVRDRRALERLADWCGHYTPWVGIDHAVGPGEAGLFLDVTGCAHLCGGEAGLLADLARRFARFGLEARLALADSPGAAWAWSRFRPAAAPILAPCEAASALRPLPVEALRLPAATAETLRRLGLRRIGDLAALPRAALAARFGADLLRRLDQALGRAGEGAAEPIAPRRQPTPYAVRRDFAEPLMVPEALAPALARLLPRLCRLLERDGRGARRLVFTLFRIDGSCASAAIGTSRPARDPAHLARLFQPRLETLDPDPGIETLTLEAPETARFAADQGGLTAAGARAAARPELARLVDSLANRLGAARVGYLAPQALHLPERQGRFVPAASAPAPDWSAWPATAAPLPLRLFAAPEPVDALEPGTGPGAPPARFLWRGRIHRTAAARGPDRRLGAWWLGEAAARDYWAVTDAAGRRLWLCRDLATGRWHAHGLLAPGCDACKMHA